MNADVRNNFAHIMMSEKNVRDLLAAFEAKHPAPSLQRQLPDGTFLKVTIQTNEDHYGNRVPGPGYVR